MKHTWMVLLLFSLALALAASGPLPEGVHDFAADQCGRCHRDAENRPGELKPVPSSLCTDCHAEAGRDLSHPVDVVPEKAIPGDMPLVAGRLVCITCHVVHPVTVRNRRLNDSLLRRPGRGAVFCASCHGIDEKGHLVFERIHRGSYKVSDRGTSLDAYTLQCIECHDRRINDPGDTLGAGRWRHGGASRLNHPVGISLDRVAGQNPRQYKRAVTLPPEIRLFDGKIGCGTCHNAYSREKNLLVMRNTGSRLCLACHIK